MKNKGIVSYRPERGVSLRVYFRKTSEEIDVPLGLMLLIRRAIRETLRYERFNQPAEVSFTCCDNAYIRRLNRRFRDKDAATDVLSFPMEDDCTEALPASEPVVLGDIVVSFERAATQAAELGHSTEREVAFLTIHSVLHLLGYDHERSATDEEDMCRRQRDIITELYGDESSSADNKTKD